MSVSLATVHHEGAGTPTNDPRGAAGGYSYWIGTDRWIRLRSPYVSYATLNYNHVSLDVCLSGDRMQYPVTDSDIALVHEAYLDCHARGEVTDDPLVRPHRFSPGSNTVCPGDKAMARWTDLSTAFRPNSEDDMQLSAATNKDGHLEVFQLNSGTITHRWRLPDGRWSTSVAFAGNGWKSVAVGENDDGRLELFATDANGAEQHCWQTAPGAGWTNWTPL